MRARPNQPCRTIACNDNGPITMIGRDATGRRAAILRAASAVGGMVVVSYVVDGVLLITPAKHPRSAA